MELAARSVAIWATSEVVWPDAAPAEAYDLPARAGRAAVRPLGQGRERGASLVEFALIVPLLTLFLFGIVQFGIAYDMKQSINSAAREGARAAAIPGNDFAAIESVSRNSFQGIQDDATVAVVVTNDTTGFEFDSAAGDTGAPCLDADPTDTDLPGNVVVTASVNYELTIPFFGTRDLTLTGRGEFRCERSG